MKQEGDVVKERRGRRKRKKRRKSSIRQHKEEEKKKRKAKKGMERRSWKKEGHGLGREIKKKGRGKRKYHNLIAEISQNCDTKDSTNKRASKRREEEGRKGRGEKEGKEREKIRRGKGGGKGGEGGEGEGGMGVNTKTFASSPEHSGPGLGSLRGPIRFQ